MHPDAATKGRIGALDGWRGIAISMVILAHASFLSHSSLVHKFTYLGPMGVGIFFAISGFLITSLLLREQQKYGGIDLAGFYQRRVFRILPPILAFLAVLVTLNHFLGLNVTKLQVVSALLLFRNYLPSQGDQDWYTVHLWSLTVEEHFYLFWPALFIWTRGNLRILLGMAFSVALWREISFHFHLLPGPWAPYRTDVRLDGLLWGCIVAIACFTPGLVTWLRKRLTGKVVLLLVIIDLASNVIKGSHYYSFYEPIIFALVVVWPIMNDGSVLRRLLDSRPLSSIGRVSYSLYIWQELWLLYPKAAMPFPHLQRLPVNIFMALACAIVSYNFIEQPAIRLGKRFALRERIIATASA